MKNLLAIILVAIALPASAANVTIPAGANIQSIINASPANTTFTLNSEFRLTAPLVPKSGDIFTGSGTLNGSKLLTSFTQSSGRWYAGGQTQQGSTAGAECVAGFNCSHPEDVFLDGKALTSVSSLSKLGAGKFFFDYGADRIYIGDNPAGHKVETSVAKQIIVGKSGINGVTIKGLTIEKAATPASMSAIDSGDGSGWLVDKSEVRLNHAVGIELYNGTVRGSFVHHNGQSGIQDTNGKDGGTALVENNEISFNNSAGYNYDWEAGGVKFAVINGLTVRNNFVHDNFGQGLWDDIDTTNALYEGNRVENNYLTGILHEIGGKATIRNNVVTNNSPTHYSDAGGQIVVYSSTDTDVSGNKVTTGSKANAIITIQENREDGHRAKNVYVHDNTITLTSGAKGNGSGLTGVAGFDAFSSKDNLKFDFNSYNVPDLAAHWEYPSDMGWASFRGKGQEAHGKLVAGVSAKASGGTLAASSGGKVFAASATPEPSSFSSLCFGVSFTFLLHRSRRAA